jgi:hypothetical protein
VTFVVEVSEPADHGINFDDFAVELLVVGGGFVEFFGELEVPTLFLLDSLAHPELRFEVDGELAVLFDDLFDVGDEFVVGVDLLLDEAVLLEVFVEEIPEMVLLNFSTHYILLLFKCTEPYLNQSLIV